MAFLLQMDYGAFGVPGASAAQHVEELICVQDSASPAKELVLEMEQRFSNAPLNCAQVLQYLF